MAEVINVRQARKRKARRAAEKTADTNRTLHGTPKPARDLAKAQGAKEKRDLEARRLDKNGENSG